MKVPSGEQDGAEAEDVVADADGAEDGAKGGGTLMHHDRSHDPAVRRRVGCLKLRGSLSTECFGAGLPWHDDQEMKGCHRHPNLSGKLAKRRTNRALCLSVRRMLWGWWAREGEAGGSRHKSKRIQMNPLIHQGEARP